MTEKTVTHAEKLESVKALIGCIFDPSEDVLSLIIQSLTQLMDRGEEKTVLMLLAEQDKVKTRH